MRGSRYVSSTDYGLGGNYSHHCRSGLSLLRNHLARDAGNWEKERVTQLPSQRSPQYFVAAVAGLKGPAVEAKNRIQEISLGLGIEPCRPSP